MTVLRRHSKEPGLEGPLEYRTRHIRFVPLKDRSGTSEGGLLGCRGAVQEALTAILVRGDDSVQAELRSQKDL